MKIKNCGDYCVLSSECEAEARSLFFASHSQYSARGADLTPSRVNREVAFTLPEAVEFASGVLADRDIELLDKRRITKLIHAWTQGKIHGEAML